MDAKSVSSGDSVTKSHYKVVIIGAGVAGCSAARTLVQNGVTDIAVVEAGAKPGGRVKTDMLDGEPLELGAQWLHGAKTNPIYTLVKDLKVVEWKGALNEEYGQIQNANIGWLLDSRSIQADDIKTIHHVQQLCDKIRDEMDVFYSSEDKPKVEHDSVGRYWKTRLLEELSTDKDNNKDNHKLQMAAFDWRQRYEGADNATISVDNISLQYWGSYVSCGYRDLEWTNGTYALFEKALLPPIQDKIIVNKAVVRIKYDSNEQVEISCKDGGRLTADVVLMTCSMGFLKLSAADFFEPTLPANTVNAIDSFGFGTTDKLYLKFPKSFWPEDLDAYSLLWLEDNIPLDDTFKDVTGSEMQWWRSIIGFDTLETHPDVLEGWIAGEAAVAMESCTEEQVLTVCWKLLEHFTGRQLPKPTLIRTCWNAEPYIRGSYSSFSSGFSRSAFDDMLSPVCHNGSPKIYFAGEALSETHNSTLHGAYECGERQAKAILKLFDAE